jgi:hypothetical protein
MRINYIYNMYKGFLYLIILFLQFLNKVQGQSNVKHHQISAGVGLLSAQQAVYPFQAEYLDYYKMNTQQLLHLKYAYQFTIMKEVYCSIGINYANFAYKDMYVSKQFSNDPNLSSDTTRLNFQSSSYLLRSDLNYYSDGKICIYTGIGIGLRTQHVTNAYVSYVDSVGKYTVEAGSPKPNQMPVGFEATIGCKYFFHKNIGCYAEAGIAKSLLQFGIAISF